MQRNVQALTSTTVYEAMIHEADVRAKIAAVLRDEVSVVDFARWIMSNSWNMHQDSSRAAVDLASNVHLLLAERDEASINDNDFKRELSALLSEPNVQFLEVRISIAVDRVSVLDAFPITASARRPLILPEILIPLQS